MGNFFLLLTVAAAGLAASSRPDRADPDPAADAALQEDTYSSEDPATSGPDSAADSRQEHDRRQAALRRMHRVSDRISLLRVVTDLRLARCKWLRYEATLPSVSIIIPFHNEHWSILLRTLHSVTSRSPPGLVRQLILVDDASTDPALGPRLHRYVSRHFPRARILRAAKPLGPIKARILGAHAANGSVLVFLGSHCEVGINWLPPLLQPIEHNYRTVACPFIDVIDERDFSVRPKDDGARGAFDWNLNYRRLPRLHEDRDRPERPFDNPIMAGDTFAISRRWFMELGGYDQGLELSGGEQYELSFKIWMCGGTMVDVPCSRVGRVAAPPVAAVPDNFVMKNYKRVAEVWMGEWKRFLYRKQHERFAAIECGDLASQKRLRDELNCRSFNWFMEKVAFDILVLYPPRRESAFSDCRIASALGSGLCIDAGFHTAGARLEIDRCVSDGDRCEAACEQRFYISMGTEIRPGRRDVCFDIGEDGATVRLASCNETHPSQNWDYNFETGQFVNEARRQCLQARLQSMRLVVRRCSSNVLQKWRVSCASGRFTKEAPEHPREGDELADIFMRRSRKQEDPFISGARVSPTRNTLPNNGGAPEREAPEREAPEREVPEREAPEREAHEREVPEREVPEREAPEREAHEREALQREASLGDRRAAWRKSAAGQTSDGAKDENGNSVKTGTGRESSEDENQLKGPS